MNEKKERMKEKRRGIIINERKERMEEREKERDNKRILGGKEKGAV